MPPFLQPGCLYYLFLYFWCLAVLICMYLRYDPKCCSGSGRASDWVELPGRGPASGQVQLQPVPCPGPPCKSYQKIHRWLLPLLDLVILQRPNHKQRPAATSARLRAAEREFWGTLRSHAASFGS